MHIYTCMHISEDLCIPRTTHHVLFDVGCTVYDAQASEVMEKSGRPYATLVGWAVLMSQGRHFRARQREKQSGRCFISAPFRREHGLHLPFDCRGLCR